MHRFRARLHRAGRTSGRAVIYDPCGRPVKDSRGLTAPGQVPSLRGLGRSATGAGAGGTPRAFLILSLVLFVLWLPHGVTPVPVANAALSAVLAALLLGPRAGVAWAVLVMALLVAPPFLPANVLEAFRVVVPPHPGPLNARDAVEDASAPHIEVSLARSADRARFIVTVADNGHGMDEETRRRMGEPFFTTKPEGRGTGPGLSTAYAAVRDLGGRIAVASTPGAGTTFTIELPAARGRVPSAEQAPAQALRGNVRVPVVDDDPMLLEAVSRQLASLGLEAEPFTDPVAALARVRPAPRAFDLLITDLDMPGLSGRELVAQAHRSEPGLPIVVLSGTPHGEPIPGAAAVLAKPASTTDLAAAVARCLHLEPARVA